MATRRLYRAGEKDSVIFGVCQGIADWKDLPVAPIRWIFAILAIGTFSAVAIVYLLLAIFIPVNPAYAKGHGTARSTIYEESVYEESNGSDYSSSRNEKLKKEYERLKKKVENLESSVFDKERDWDKRFYGDDK